MGARGLGQVSIRQRAGRQVLGDLELCRHIERLGHTVPVTELHNGFGWSVLSSFRHLLIPFGCVNRSQSAERCASAAPGSGSDGGADAGGSRLQAVVRRWTVSHRCGGSCVHLLPSRTRRAHFVWLERHIADANHGGRYAVLGTLVYNHADEVFKLHAPTCIEILQEGRPPARVSLTVAV